MHKDYDTFRFEFQLPKTVDKLKCELDDRNVTASIQLCICFRTGTANETTEYWDSNDGLNYEILQYVIDLERLKPNQQVSITSAASVASAQLRSTTKHKSSYLKYESNNKSLTTSSSTLAQETGIYY